MKKVFVRFAYVFAAIVMAAAFMAFVSPQDKDFGGPWEIPAKYKEMKNTYADDASLVKVGKMMFSKHCKSCHGARGLGDGSKAASMKVAMRPFNSAEFQKQADGVIYYQSIIGRDEMPNFEKKIPDDEDRWALIMFLRTIK